MGNDFDALATNSLYRQMVPVADALYAQIFPGGEITRLKNQGGEPHPLDKYFGIDATIIMPCGGLITLQEKFRENQHLQKYGDFTQEYENATGTIHRRGGEWFHLASQLYFYGWATPEKDAFARWILLDVLRYRLLVQDAGGLEMLGRKQVNRIHGRASFFGIPIGRLAPAIVTQG